MMRSGPTIQPTRQPIILYSFETEPGIRAAAMIGDRVPFGFVRDEAARHRRRHDEECARARADCACQRFEVEAPAIG